MEKLIFGSLEMSFTPEGDLRLLRNGIVSWAMNIAPNRQEELIDFLLQGYKENLHKGAQSPSIDTVWEKIEKAISGGAILFSSVTDDPEPQDDVLVEEVRNLALSKAKEELTAGNYSTAAKLIAIYEKL